MLLYDTEHNYD